MTSSSLQRWRGERAVMLDQLFDAHRSIGGAGVGRRGSTSELNKARVLRLAAQFQGFCKDLHQETAVAFGALAQPNDVVVARVVAAGLQANRDLDRQNAQESSLANDFGRFGMKLWTDMEMAHARTAARRAHLKWFNMTRNAVAHDDADKLAKVIAAGYTVDVKTIRRWRSNLDGLAGTLDQVTAAHLGRLFGTAPW